MPTDEERGYLLWLSSAEISADKVQKLLEAYGSLENLWNAFGTNEGPKFRDAAQKQLEELHTPQAMANYQERLQRANVRVLFRDDASYPELLNCIDDPPYALYYAGDITAFRRPLVAVVGSREPSAYGRDMARSIARDLAEVGVGIVSGLARGIDSYAHEGALKAGGVTIGVLGSGLNVPYPPENVSMLRRIATSGGLILSEFPLDSGPVTYHFPHRNRIISGLCHGLVFVEGKVKSGGMLTVASALKQGREVFAVPGQAGLSGAEGPLTILREGARLVTSAKDILADLSLELELILPDKEKDLTDEHASTLGQAIGVALAQEAMTLDGLAAKLGRTNDELLTELSMMEIMGQIRKEPGNVFALVPGNTLH